MTEAQVKALEDTLAGLVKRLDPFLEGEGSFPTLRSRVEAIQKEVEVFKGLNLKSVVESYDKMTARIEGLTETIKRHKGGMYVPGAEDYKFSMLKAIVGAKTGRWKEYDAEHERDVMTQAREKFRATKAAQSVGDDSLGGFFVPDQVIPDVIAAIYTKSVFINAAGEGTQRVSVLDGLVGANVKIPRFDGGVIAFWIGEEDAYVQSLLTVGDITMNPRKLGILVKLTDSILRFQGFGFETLMRNDMVRAAAKKIDYTAAFGRGTNDEPRGIIHTNGVRIYRTETGEVFSSLEDARAVTDWQGGELDFEGLDDMLLAFEEDDVEPDNNSWISSPRYFKRLRNIRSLNFSGQPREQAPFLLGSPMITKQRLADIIGDFDASSQIPSNDLPAERIGGTTTDASPGDDRFTTVFGGDLTNAVWARWGGFEIEDDAGRGAGFVSDHTYVKLRMYSDFGVRQGRRLIFTPDVQVRD